MKIKVSTTISSKYEDIKLLDSFSLLVYSKEQTDKQQPIQKFNQTYFLPVKMQTNIYIC